MAEARALLASEDHEMVEVGTPLPIIRAPSRSGGSGGMETGESSEESMGEAAREAAGEAAEGPQEEARGAEPGVDLLNWGPEGREGSPLATGGTQWAGHGGLVTLCVPL